MEDRFDPEMGDAEASMANKAIEQILVLVQSLSVRQRKVLAERLAALDKPAKAIEVVERRQREMPGCPHCGNTHIVKNGHADGLQRYLCRACATTFNALTGTPLARLHLREKWLEQAQALHEGWSLSQVQERLGVARTTALRWRHRFLAVPKDIRAQRLTGIAEADQTYFLRSAKGQRQALARKARRRGGKARRQGLSHEQVAVLVARDRAGQTADFILQANDSRHASDKLRPVLGRDAIICTEGDAVMQATARQLGIEHHAVNVSAGIRVDGPWHVQNVNAYHSRLKNWIRRFKGVSTKYLDSYLGWFRTIDRAPSVMAEPTSLLGLAVGAGSIGFAT